MKHLFYIIFSLQAFTIFSQSQYTFSDINLEKKHGQNIPLKDLKSSIKSTYEESPHYQKIDFQYIISKKIRVDSIFLNPKLIKTDILDTIAKLNSNIVRDSIFMFYDKIKISPSHQNREVFLVFEYPYPENIQIIVNQKKIAESSGKTFFIEANITKFLTKDSLQNFAFVVKNNKKNFDTKLIKTHLYSTPKLQISDFQTFTAYNNNTHKGKISIIGEVRNLDKKDYYKYSLSFILFDYQGKKVFEETSPMFSFGKSKNRTKGIQYQKEINQPYLWNKQETNKIYTICTILRTDDGELLEVISHKISFTENSISKCNIIFQQSLVDSLIKNKNLALYSYGLLEKVYTNSIVLENTKTQNLKSLIEYFSSKGILTNSSDTLNDFIHGYTTIKKETERTFTFNDKNIFRNPYIDSLSIINFPVKIDSVDFKTFKYNIKNELPVNFKEKYRLYFELKLNGVTINSGPINIDLSTNEEKIFTVPLKTNLLQKDYVYKLRLSVLSNGRDKSINPTLKFIMLDYEFVY